MNIRTFYVVKFPDGTYLCERGYTGLFSEARLFSKKNHATCSITQMNKNWYSKIKQFDIIEYFVVEAN